jgi:hypothetical protein
MYSLAATDHKRPIKNLFGRAAVTLPMFPGFMLVFTKSTMTAMIKMTMQFV